MAMGASCALWQNRETSARLELSLLDPQIARDLGIIAAHLLEETLGVL